MARYKGERTGQCSGVYPCHGEPGLLMAENTSQATREKLLDDFKGATVNVPLPSGSVK